MEKFRSNRIKFAELALLILIWVTILSIPLLFNNDAQTLGDMDFSFLMTVIPLALIFIINRFVLVKRFLFRKQYINYFVSVVLLIGISTVGASLLHHGKPNMPPPKGMNPSMRPIHPPAFGNPPSINNPMKGRPIPEWTNLLIFSLLLVGFDTGIRSSFKLLDTEKEKAKLEKENVENQLAFLRNQISPHFFMNTLNNIHALIDIDSEEAKTSIIQLSKLMRHILYESEVDKVPIKKEMDFITNYVGLMKLRFSDKVEINLKMPDVLPNVSIPPILFVSFIENAFKHGISYNRESFVDISIGITDNWMNLKISNSKNQEESSDSASGIGVANTLKRLELIYKDNYQIEITDGKEVYSIYLNIPL